MTCVHIVSWPTVKPAANLFHKGHFSFVSQLKNSLQKWRQSHHTSTYSLFSVFLFEIINLEHISLFCISWVRLIISWEFINHKNKNINFLNNILLLLPFFIISLFMLHLSCRSVLSYCLLDVQSQILNTRVIHVTHQIHRKLWIIGGPRQIQADRGGWGSGGQASSEAVDAAVTLRSLSGFCRRLCFIVCDRLPMIQKLKVLHSSQC